MQNNQEYKKKSVYESIYGGKGYCLAGPFFYLISGIMCLFIVSIISFSGSYYITAVENLELLRPDITFPFLGIIVFLCLPGSIIGLTFGITGLIWRYRKK